MTENASESPVPHRKNTISSLMRKVSSMSSRGPNGSRGPPTIIPPNCKVKIVIRTYKPELTVSFLIVNMPGFVMAVGKGEDMLAEKIVNDPRFWQRCSFHPCTNLWYKSFCAFESIKESSRYITLTNNIYKCRKYDGTENFKQEASFVFDKKKAESRLGYRRRALSSIAPPKFDENSRIKHKIQRKSSLNNNSATNDSDHLTCREKQLPRVNALYSMAYDTCAGCLNLKIYSSRERSETTSSIPEEFLEPRESAIVGKFPDSWRIRQCAISCTHAGE